MSCRSYEDLALISIDQELGPSEAKKLESHLATCPSCCELLRQLEEDRELLAEGIPWEGSNLEDIRRLVSEQLTVQSTQQRWGVWLWAAMLILAIGAAFLSLEPIRRPRGEVVLVERVAPWMPGASTSRMPLPSWTEAELPLQEAQGVRSIDLSPRQSLASTALAPPLAETVADRVRTKPEPLLIQMVSDDPDVVIYWLVDSEIKENKDARSS